jgi:glucan biosynthesis protein C
MTAEQPGRLVYLDHLRAFAMLFGVLVHATTLGAFGPLEAFAGISDQFRMGVFFAVSGFFAAMLIGRRGAGRFRRDRALAIGLPFLTALVLFNPPALWLVHAWHNPGSDLGPGAVLAAAFDAGNGLQGAVVWHLHLWFLAALLAYTLAAAPLAAALAAAARIPGLRRACARIPAALVPLAVALAVAAAVVAMRALFTVALKPLDAPWIVRATLSYLPWYALGLLAWSERGLWQRLHRVDPVLIGTALLLWAVSRGMVPGLEVPAALRGPFEIARREIDVAACLCALLWLFRRVLDRETAAGRALTDSVYTVYLLHYLALHLAGFALSPLLGADTAALFWAAAALAFATTFALHRGVVARLPLLRLLLNGRPAGPARPAAAGATG